jgi:RimJ/RimL family protein N-acetyltransferase
MEIPQLTTQRLLMRGFQEFDLDAYALMSADPEGMRYVGSGQILTRQDAWRSMATIIGHWHLHGYGMWAVVEHQSGEMIGRVGCWQPEGWPGFEIGWTIRRAWWNNGFATEAAQAAISFAFENLNQSRVISLIRPQNAASIRVAEKLGEQLQGSLELLGSQALIYGLDRQTAQ